MSRTTQRSASRDLVGLLALAVVSPMSVTGMLAGFGVLYPAMMRDQGWSAAEVTVAYSLSQLTYGLTAIGSGLFVDRFGVRRTMFLGCTFLGLGVVWLTRAGSLWEVYLAWTIAAGLGASAAGMVPLNKLLAARAGRYYGRATGVVTAGFGAGAFVMPPAAQLIVDAVGWRPAAGAMGFGLLALLIPLIAWNTSSHRREVVAARSSAKLPVGYLFRQPPLWLLCAAMLCFGYVTVLYAHQVAHLLQAGFPTTVAASIAGVNGLFQALGGLTAGWLVDRWGGAKLQAVTSTLLSIGLLALIASSPALPWLPVVYLLVGSPARGGIGVGNVNIARRRFGGPLFGLVTGMMETSAGVGAFLGSWLVALIRDGTGSYVPGLSTLVPAALGVALCAQLAARYGRRTTDD